MNHSKLSMITILTLGLISCQNLQNKTNQSDEKVNQSNSNKIDSIPLLKTNFVNGELYLSAKVDTTGKGLLLAEYVTKEKAVSKTQIDITLTQDSLKNGILFKEKEDSFLLSKYCEANGNLFFFCLNSSTYLNGTNLYAVSLDNENLKFLSLTGDKLDLLASEGFWIIQKNKNQILKINPYRSSRKNNVTIYEIKDDLIVLKKEMKVKFFEEDDFPANNEAIMIFNNILQNVY